MCSSDLFGFRRSGQARLDALDEDGVVAALPVTVRGIDEMQAGRRRIFAMDAHFEGAFAVQGAVFFVLPAGVVDKHQEIVAVLLIDDSLALPVNR